MRSSGIKIKYLIFIAAVSSILIYGMVRLVYTVVYMGGYSPVEVTMSFLLLFAELFMLAHAFGYGTHLLTTMGSKDVMDELIPAIPFPAPTVAILVAARHEPKEVLEQTFRSLTNLRYSAKTIYFLDDSSDEKYKREAEEICKKYEIELFRREVRHGAKAGIVNDCLRTKIKEKYVAIFDADQSPMPSFLNPLISLLEGDESLAFIQTPQFYSNADTSKSPVAFGASHQQAVFYEYICESKGIKQSMFCCGTNVVFRTEALMSVNGFDEAYITEDIATSVRLHMAGWKSLYYNHVGTFGMGPEVLSEYFKQQARWARGSFGVLRNVVGSLIRHPRSMAFSQWMEYLLAGTYYFVGLAFFILMMCPIIYLIFKVPSFFIRADIYLAVFIPYLLLTLGVFYMTLRQRNYRVRDIFVGQMLTFITFPIYIRSAILGLLGIQGSFGITLKGKGGAMPYIYLWPQILMMLLCAFAMGMGFYRFLHENNISMLVNCIWVFYHFIIMSSILYFNVGNSEG